MSDHQKETIDYYLKNKDPLAKLNKHRTKLLDNLLELSAENNDNLYSRINQNIEIEHFLAQN